MYEPRRDMELQLVAYEHPADRLDKLHDLVMAEYVLSEEESVTRYRARERKRYKAKNRSKCAE